MTLLFDPKSGDFRIIMSNIPKFILNFNRLLLLILKTLEFGFILVRLYTPAISHL